MSAIQLNPPLCAAFLLAAFVVAGACQTMWLAAPFSMRFAVPLDGGRSFQGRPLFGTNKTVRGVLMMVPATGASFVLLSTLLANSPGGLSGLWPLSSTRYMLLGLWAGLGFMAGELPNSFIKRRLDVAPGAAAEGRFLMPFFFVLDRLDSILGALFALALVVPVPWSVWIYVALVGPTVHWFFSVALFHLGVKARPA